MTENSLTNNFRSSVITEPSLMPPSSLGGGASTDTILRTPYVGNVRALPPPLPQSPMQSQYGTMGYNNYNSPYGGYGSAMGGGLFGSGYGGLGGYGGYGGYNNYGGMGYGGYGAYNRFGGLSAMDPEARFIQLAEASSRPAFQSIESLVSAIGNIASMLDSTFFALTSSFRAILGVAANFGRLRSVFSQFWHTFAIFRGINWIYRKMLYWLRISDMDPSSEAFKQAFAEAVNNGSAASGAPQLPRKGQSPWPVIAFLSFIFTAPYLIMKLLGTVTATAQEEARDPSKWMQPIETVALYDFQARNPNELTMRSGDRVLVAPKEIQNTTGLLNTGWALATIDGQTSGAIPINYVKSPQQLRQERQQILEEQQLKQQPSVPNSAVVPTVYQKPQMDVANLSASAFPAPPRYEQPLQQQTCDADIDFEIAPQPIGPPTTADVALNGGFVDEMAK